MTQHCFAPRNFLRGGVLLLGVVCFALVHSFGWVGETPEAFAAPGINRQIPFQGRVVNLNGTSVVSGSYPFTFSLYTQDSAGVAIWTETKNLTVTNGIFGTNLGSSTSLPSVLNFNQDALYLGIDFNGDGEMTPRVQIGAVPQAINAEKVSGLTVTNTTGSLTIPNSAAISFGASFTTGADPLSLVTTGATSVTLPTTGVLATLAGSETLSNKTLGVTTFTGQLTPSGSVDIGSSGNRFATLYTATTNSTNLTVSGTSSLGTVTGGTWQGTVIAAQYGGTGLNTSASTGIPVLAGGTWSVLANGSNTQCLTISGGVPTWGSCSAAGTITGAGVTGQLSYWDSNSTIANAAGLTWNSGASELGIGTASTIAPLTIRKASSGIVLAVRNTADSATVLSINDTGDISANSLTVANGLTVSAGSVVLPAGEIGNAELANSSLTVTAGTNLTGGGAVSLGGSTTLNVVGNPSFATSVTAPTVNATSSLQLNGVSVNTSGTLSNVAYLAQANAFTAGLTVTTSSGAQVSSRYDASNRLDVTTSSTGLTTLTAAGSAPGIVLDATATGGEITLSTPNGSFAIETSGITIDTSGATPLNLDVSAVNVLDGANIVGDGTSQIQGFVWGGATIGTTVGGTGLTSYTTGDIIYASGTDTLGKRAVGSNGDCLIVSAGLPTWGSCAQSTNTLQAAYGNGNTIATTDARDFALTLANTTTDSNFIVNIASGSTGRFTVQSNGFDVFGVDASGTTITSGGLTVTSGSVSLPAGEIGNTELANSSLTVTAGTGLSGGGVVSLGGSTSLSLPNIGTAGTYGSASQVPVFTTDAQGRVTGVSATNIAIAASAVTTGQLAPAQGGTGFDSSASTGLPYVSAGAWSAIANGSNNQCLVISGGVPTWGSCSAGGGVTGSGTTGTLTYWDSNTTIASASGLNFASGALAIGTATTTNGTFTVTRGTSGIAMAVRDTTDTSTTFSVSDTGAIIGTSLGLGSGTITSGTVNGQTISSAANLTGSLTVANGLTVTAGTVSLPAGSIDNAELANSSLTVSAGTNLSGGGSVSLGGSTTLNVVSNPTFTGVVTASSVGTGLSVTNNASVGGTLTAGTLTVSTGGASITGGLNNNSGGITNTGTVSGATISGASNTLTDIGNASLTNSSLTVTAGTNLSGGGSVSLGGSTTLNIVANPTFAGLITGSNTGGTALALTGAPGASATSSLLRLGDAIVGGDASGTFIGLNAVSGYTGNLVDLQVDGTSEFSINENGNVVAGNISAGTLTAGTYNGQTISSSANFTGSLTVANGFTVSAGAVSLPAGSISNATLANSSITVTAGTNLSGGGAVSLGGSTTLNIVNNPTFAGLVTANAALSVTGGIDNNSGGITNTGAVAGATTIAANNTVTLSGTGGNQLALTGAPAASATSSLIQLGSAIAGGSANGTYLGINPASFSGNFADFQVGGTSVFSVSAAGALVAASTINGATISGGSLSASAVNGLSVSAGTITVGTWQGTAIADTYIADTLTIDSSSSVQWVALTGYPSACAAGSAISTLADVPTCTAFNTDTSITLQDAYNAASGNSILTTDARDLTITLADTATDSNFLINIATGSTGKFAVQNNGTDIFRVTSAENRILSNGLIIDAGGLTVTTGGATVSAGGITVTGNSTITGTLGGLTGLTVASGGASITGGINNNTGGITNAGAIGGATTINASGAITGGSLTDGTATLASGSLSGAVNGTFSGTVQGATLNATSAIQLNGVSINTAGTLTNVAYENQANAFTLANTFSAAGTALTVTNNASIGGQLSLAGQLLHRMGGTAANPVERLFYGRTPLGLSSFDETLYNFGNIWVPKDSNRSWKDIAMSADGSRQTAVEDGGQIYVSTDYGNTWTAKDSARLWSSVNMSADGSRQTAVVMNGQIYVSTDYGDTWTAKDSSRGWQGVSMSADGSLQTAIVYGGQIYVSTDYGDTWTAKDSSRNWQGVSMSASGRYQTAGVYGGQIYVSTDYGDTWTAKDSSRNWYGVAMSADGSRQTAVTEAGQIYVSTNFGDTWTAKESNRDWVDVAMSADGSRQTAVAISEQIYVSTNYGDTWTAKGSAQDWWSVAMSADGSRQTAVAISEQIYVSVTEKTTQLANLVINPGSAYTGNLLDVQTNGTSRLTVAQSGATTIGAGGLTISAGGLTVTGTTTISGGVISLNTNSNNAVNIATGTSTGAVSIGGGSNTFALNSTALDISTAGALTGVTGITTSGAYIQSGTSANTLTGTTTFSRTGANAVAITGAPQASATVSLLQLGSAIASGSASGTYLGLNGGSGYSGDLLHFQVNSASVLQVNASGTITQPLSGGYTSVLSNGSLYLGYSDFGSYNTTYGPQGLTTGGPTMADYTIDLNLSTGTTLTVTNSNVSYAADINLADGALKTAGTTRITNAGVLQNITGLTVTSGGASITGGINNNSGGITNAGAIGGASTIDATGQVTLSATGGNALRLTGDPAASATSSLLQLGNAIAGGSASGTVLGANADNGFVGNLMDLQVNGTSMANISATGNLTIAATLTVGQTISSATGNNLQLQANTGIVALNMPATQNRLRVYDSGGTKYVDLTHDGTNGVLSASSGELQISGAGSNQFILGSTGQAMNLIFEESATISGQGTNTISLGQSGDTIGLNVSGVTYNVGTFTATGLTLATTATGSTALLVNGPSGQSANLLDLQVNSASRLSVSAAGALTAASTITSTATGSVALALSGAPATSATSSLVRLGSLISGGSSDGTYFGINSGSGYIGNFLDFQVDGTTTFKVAYSGATTITAGAAAATPLTVTANGSQTADLIVVGKAFILDAIGKFASAEALPGVPIVGVDPNSGSTRGDLTTSSGPMYPSDGGGLTLSVSAGAAFSADHATGGSRTITRRCVLTGSTNLTLTDNTTEYVYLLADGSTSTGGLQCTLNKSSSMPTFDARYPVSVIAKTVTSGGGITSIADTRSFLGSTYVFAKATAAVQPGHIVIQNTSADNEVDATTSAASANVFGIVAVGNSSAGGLVIVNVGGSAWAQAVSGATRGACAGTSTTSGAVNNITTASNACAGRVMTAASGSRPAVLVQVNPN